MKTVIYDCYDDKKVCDLGCEHIRELVVEILSGDELLTVIYQNGEKKHFDSSETRFLSFSDGLYIINDQNGIEKWLKWKPQKSSRGYSRDRKAEFEEYEVQKGVGIGMIISMDEKTHTYFVNGEVASISVTELLHKHGLAPNYAGIDEGVLEEARERGKEIHADIESWVRGQEMGFVPETREGLAFAKWAQDKMLEAVPEQALAIDYKGMTVACTVDLRGIFKMDGNKCAVIDDHKATSRFYREYVSWQTSLYDYIARSLNGRIVNGEKIKWTGADALICTLFDKEGGLTVKNCDKIPDSEIERLLECELKGERYTRRELVLPDEMGLELNAAEETLVFYEKAYKAAKERSDKARAALTAEMERQGVFTYESDRLKVSYRAASESIIVDSTRLKKEQPQLFAAYSKTSKRKATVIITVKGEENGEA